MDHQTNSWSPVFLWVHFQVVLFNFCWHSSPMTGEFWASKTFWMFDFLSLKINWTYSSYCGTLILLKRFNLLPECFRSTSWCPSFLHFYGHPQCSKLHIYLSLLHNGFALFYLEEHCVQLAHFHKRICWLDVSFFLSWKDWRGKIDCFSIWPLKVSTLGIIISR